MAKIAMLIGVSEYKSGLLPLPSAIRDIEAMKKVLSDPQIGEFKTVGVLSNPDPATIQIDLQAISSLTRDKNDLIFLFFSGYILQDERGKLYFATRSTGKPLSKERLQTSTVSFEFIKDLLDKCQSRRQIIVLDCCLSGAFTEDLQTDKRTINIRSQLGAEGRAILTADNSTDYSFVHKEDRLSVYTNYLVEGLETGMADRDQDAMVAVEEWHEYAQEKVLEIAPTVKPEIYAIKESYKILLAKVSPNNAKHQYYQEVKRLISNGNISSDNYLQLKQKQLLLNISPEDAQNIEVTTVKFYQNYQKKLARYEETLAQVIAEYGTLNDKIRLNLKQLQQVLGIKTKDIQAIEKRLTQIKSQLVVDTAPLPESLATPIPLNPDFVELCKQELASYVGPMANMMVKEALAGKSKSDISCQQLVEAIASKIRNLQQAETFKRKLLLSLCDQ
ncbi:peptidase C14 caspase catalytic subunit p20 [Rippkaea orientalis PCC 8801]|uniref:Peptidase C14 caspase catalytic subunit p20 n=1 Tax=Rippkaea orientalis (strain PCC 8801 / RF-1) TaxID=41431 RepID=B7K2K0_RIPO1|nr:caspase family protein [Rippkaea orientalis]ACK66393.1 peptidase C14 caspase catalytic subunit p20 [Rippkaea orientalis PCC 8801]